MTPTRTLRIKSPTDLIAAVPVLLGFHPEESAVMLTTGGATEPFFARVDLPHGDGDLAAVVDDLCEVAGRHGVHDVALVLLTHDAARARATHDALVAGLATRAVDVQVALRADGRRWFPLCGLAGDPDTGEEYDLTTHPFTLEAMVEGRVVHASRSALGDSLLPVDPDEVERVVTAVDGASDRLMAAARTPSGGRDRQAARQFLVAEGRWLQQWLRRALTDEDGPDAGSLSDRDLGRLVVGLQSTEVRDVAWAEMTRDNARRHVDLWRDLVRRTPLDVLGPPATLLAFAAWLSGNGALAWCALDRARTADPDYSMAALVERALTCAVPPSTWKPLTEEGLSLFAG